MVFVPRRSTICRKCISLTMYATMSPILAHIGLSVFHLSSILASSWPHLGPTLAHLVAIVEHLGLIMENLVSC